MKKILAKRDLIFYLYVMRKLNKGQTLTYEEAQFLVNIGDEELFAENPEVIATLGEEEAEIYRNNLYQLRNYLELKELSPFTDQDCYNLDEISKIIR